MTFNISEINLEQWNHWKKWNADITLSNAMLGIAFVTEFCKAYKKKTNELEKEFQQAKQSIHKAFAEEKSAAEDEFKKETQIITNANTTFVNEINSQKKKVEQISKGIDFDENNVYSFDSIPEYVELLEQYNSCISLFNSLTDKKEKIAAEMLEAKKKQLEERIQNTIAEIDRRYNEEIENITLAYSDASKRLSDVFRNLFEKEIFSRTSYEEYEERVNKYKFNIQNYQCRKLNSDYVYVGNLQQAISQDFKSELADELIGWIFGSQSVNRDGDYVIKLPYCQKLTDGVGMFINELNNGIIDERKSMLSDILQMQLLNLFMTFPAGQVEAYTVDPSTRGAVFQTLKMLGNDESRIIGEACAESNDIEQMLSSLRSKVDGIANNYGKEFEARMRREPYYALAISNFPEAFTSRAIKELLNIVKNSAACGVAVYITSSETRLKNLSGTDKINAEEIMRTLQCVSGNSNYLKCNIPDADETLVTVLESSNCYDNVEIQNVINVLSEGIQRYRPITTTFFDIYPNINDMNTWLNKDSTLGINIPVGIRGANEVVNISLGEVGASNEHHVLVEGDIGVGKTAFLHTLIMSTLVSYGPHEVEICLLDFKEGVEFKVYSDYDISSFKIISIQSERDFGLKTFRAVKEEFIRRGDRFKSEGVSNIWDYRKTTNKAMPKILLIIDEYQELFSKDDAITSECTEILKTLITQGRVYGIHIILATQNIKQACLNNETYDQMVGRVAIKGSKNVLSEDNDGVQQLWKSTAGTTVYNNNKGDRNANKIFKTAYIGEHGGEWHREMLSKISTLQSSMLVESDSEIPRKVLYTSLENNVKHVINSFVIGNTSAPKVFYEDNENIYGLYIGEANELKEDLRIGLGTYQNHNLLIAAPSEQTSKLIVNAIISLLYDDIACKKATKSNRLIHMINMSDDKLNSHLESLEDYFPETIKYATFSSDDNDWSLSTSKHEMIKTIIDSTYEELCKRTTSDYDENDRIFVIVTDIEKTSVLDTDTALSDITYREKLKCLLENGAEHGINFIASTSNLDVMIRLLGEECLGKFAFRTGCKQKKEHMERLFNEHDADSLKADLMLFFKMTASDNKKYRLYEIPTNEWIKLYSEKIHSYEGVMNDE